MSTNRHLQTNHSTNTSLARYSEVLNNKSSQSAKNIAEIRLRQLLNGAPSEQVLHGERQIIERHSNYLFDQIKRELRRVAL